MMLVEETTVPAAALPVAEFKDHLRLGTGFADDGVQDAVLESFLRAAISAIEARTGKVLIERAFSWSVTRWRDDAGQGLPVAPISAVSEVRRVFQDGSEEVVAPEVYRLVADAHRPVLAANGASLPIIPVNGSVTVRFTAGWGGAFGALPADLAQAVLLLAAHYYEYRHETGLGEGCMPFGVTALLQRYRPVRLSAGGVS